MEKDLSKKIKLELSLGHLFMVWEVLSNKVSCDPFNNQFSEIEKRVIWALEDLCEYTLKKMVAEQCKSRTGKCSLKELPSM